MENIKIMCEVIALIAGAGFFLFKAIAGLFYVSLSLEVNSDKRRSLNDNEDILIIDLSLTGGENAILDVHKIQGRIEYNETAHIFDFDGVERLNIDSNSKELKIKVPWQSWTKHKYRIGVKETTSFAKELTVPSNSVCKIEVVVVDRRKLFNFSKSISQWRTSDISMPNDIKDNIYSY